MLVSIMMPAHNAGKFLEDAITSVLNQTYQDFELCIVDDGSDDLTYYIALSFKDKRIKVKKIQHAGCPAARNDCLGMMSGEVFARLDADDTHDPERIEKQVALLKDYDIVTTGYSWFEGGISVPRRSHPMEPDVYMRGGPGPVCASIVCRREIYRKVGDFDETLLAGSDGDWNFRAILEGYTWGYIPEPLYHQRRHKDQLSQSSRGLQRTVHETCRRKYTPLWEGR